MPNILKRIKSKRDLGRTRGLEPMIVTFLIIYVVRNEESMGVNA